jgi:uncharacterized SAM-binding protein YcdF (DUF218 family)
MVDAIIVPGGGVRAQGKLPLWMRQRFDHALTFWHGEPVICLSAGTIFKPLPRDEAEYPLFESVAGARYLLEKGVPADKIFTETASYDTIGNAYFARVVHTEPMGWRRLLIVTSAFHMARTRAIFEWVFGLSPVNETYHLDFRASADEEIEPIALEVRQQKENAGLQRLIPLIQEVRTLAHLHQFLFTRHDAYAVARLAQSRPSAPEDVKNMY